MASDYVLLSNQERIKLGASNFLVLSDNSDSIPITPVHPIAPITGSIDYGRFKAIGASLVQRFGLPVSIKTKNKTINSAEPWNNTFNVVEYPAHAVKVPISNAPSEREFLEEFKEIQAKFIISCDTLVRVDDYFVFTDSTYTIVKLNRLDPGSIIVIYEALCK